jgi:hypothetical protein
MTTATCVQGVAVEGRMFLAEWVSGHMTELFSLSGPSAVNFLAMLDATD